MVVLNKIYTKTGDDGSTALASGERRQKHDLRVSAYGTVDETNAVIGLCVLHAGAGMKAMLAAIQNDLFDLGADLATPASDGEENTLRVTDQQTARLEAEIDGMNGELKPLRSFVLPGGSPVAAHLHLARTVARRAERLIVELGGLEGIDGYGKGAIVGEAGEIEHGALWHVPGGYAMRERLGEARAIVPSAMKLAGMGAALDVPLGHINAAYVRSHFDAMEIRVPDAPRANEIAFVLAMAKGPRIHSRMGGLEAWDVKGEDGLR